MASYAENTYGDRIADVYDELYSEVNPSCIDLLAEFAGSGPALELGIGTGRIALPLQARGISVKGIDSSESMVVKLHAKPRGKNIDVYIGSFERFDLDHKYQLIYVVFNTLFALPTQDQQIACLQSVSSHLASGGFFIIEAFVPDLARFNDYQSVRLITLSDDEVRLDVSKLDPVGQQIESRNLILSEEGIQSYPVRLRYIWPAELDLMARIAGLSLRDRWGSWSKQPFTRECNKHISVYTNVS